MLLGANSKLGETDARGKKEGERAETAGYFKTRFTESPWAKKASVWAGG